MQPVLFQIMIILEYRNKINFLINDHTYPYY